MGSHYIDEDEGFNDFLRELISLGKLDDPALGITKLVIDKGEQALSDKQRYIFEKHVIGTYTYEECTRCHSNIPWSEMYEAYDHGGRCGWCLHMENKQD